MFTRHPFFDKPMQDLISTGLCRQSWQPSQPTQLVEPELSLHAKKEIAKRFPRKPCVYVCVEPGHELFFTNIRDSLIPYLNNVYGCKVTETELRNMFTMMRWAMVPTKQGKVIKIYRFSRIGQGPRLDPFVVH